MINTDDVLKATNNGLDIILYYYPQARECVQDTRKPFSARNEKTPSAYLRQFGDQWKVTDFGDDAHARSAFDICMSEEGLRFYEALCLLSDRYGVSRSLSKDINKPEIRQREASPEETDGQFSIEFKTEWTKSELELFGHRVNQTHVDKLSYRSVIWYSKTKKNDKGQLETTTILSTDNYPIFARECATKDREGKESTFLKVYQPLNLDKSFRFFYNGTKPKDYINGLNELRTAYREYNAAEQKIHEANTSNEGKPYKEKKLDAAVLCSGERDAVNCLSYGYCPLWLNSESATLQEADYREIMRMVDKLYNIPDIDTTGRRRGILLGLKYLDLNTVKLPEWLGTYKDMRGKPRKDLRDFIELRREKRDFEDLISRAMPYKFWEWVSTPKGVNLEINTAYMLNFLTDSGFGKLQEPTSKKETLVQVVGSVVREVTSKDIRAFLVDFVRSNVSDIKVVNLVLNSSRTKTVTMDDLNKINIDFTVATSTSQFLFFQNKTIEVCGDQVREFKPGECDRYVWEHKICKHNFKRLPPTFKIQQMDNDWYIDIENKDSHFFRYLINSSRIYWRQEFEERETGNEETDKQYREDSHFTIDGQRLTYEEIAEQQQNLVAKIFALGYIMHKFRYMSRPWILWVMEDRVSEDGVSSGGSGKSFFFRLYRDLKEVITHGGRNKKLTENQHIFENVTRFTDMVLIDDFDQYGDFEFFYDQSTSGINVNGKHVKSEYIPYEDSAIFAFTSNFAPRKNDSATIRRLLYVVFSDWYHQRTDDNGYRETRTIMDDFGAELYGQSYKDEYWNQDFNFLVDCMQFYFSVLSDNVKIQPPLAKVHERMNAHTMGIQFQEWAEVYFSVEGTNVNKELVREEVMKEFQNDTNLKGWSSKQFSKALVAFAKNSPHIYELNPSMLQNSSKRIVRNINGKTKEILYVRTIQDGQPAEINTNSNPF